MVRKFHTSGYFMVNNNNNMNLDISFIPCDKIKIKKY